VWGPSTHDFDPERFLRDKSLARSQNFRPFGGGYTLCPGRFIARKAIYTIVALLFCRYDVTLDQGDIHQKLPRLDDTTAGLGTMAPMPGSDIKLVIKPMSI
jgi:cytochrome P450